MVRNSPANAGDLKDEGLDPWVGKIPWRKKWKPTAAFLPGESHGGAWLATVHGVTKSWTRLKRLSTHAPKSMLRTATSNRVTRSRGLCHRPVASAWEPSPSRPSSPHGDTERERDWLKVTQQVPGRAGKRTPAHISPSLGFPEGGCQPAILASPSPGLPGCSHPWFMTPRSPSEVCRRRGPGPQEMGSPGPGPGGCRSIVRAPALYSISLGSRFHLPASWQPSNYPIKFIYYFMNT